MQKDKRTPLGYIELDSGLMPVYIMNDLFLNHFFENEENWEILRSIVNIFVDAYTEIVQYTTAKPVAGAVAVETQYKYLMKLQSETKTQDLKITEETAITFIEFQNSAYTTPPIEKTCSKVFWLGNRA